MKGVEKMEKGCSPREVRLGDVVLVGERGSRREGTVELISLRGVNVRTEEGVHFYKWAHVRLHKK